MEEIFYSTAIYSSIAATVFLILTKYRIIQYLQSREVFLLNKIANCMLCTCFWLCLVITIIGLIFGAGYNTLICPFAGAALTRAIIN